MGEGVDRAILELGGDCRIHVRIRVAERDRAKRIDEIDIFVAVDVPDLRSLAARNEIGRHPERIVCDAFRKSLGAERNRLQRALQKLFRLCVANGHLYSPECEGLARAWRITPIKRS